MNKYTKKHLVLTVLAIFQGSVALQARWFWPQPASVTVVQHSYTSPAEGIVALGGLVVLGVAGIVQHCKKKKKFREYVETFRDMGYTKERAKVYAQMAMDHPQGFQAVLNSIDQEDAMKSQHIAEQKIEQNKQVAQEKMQEVQHQQKIKEMSHQHKLNLLTHLVIVLSGIIFFGLGFFLFARK